MAVTAVTTRIRKHINALADPKRWERAKYHLIRHYAERGRAEMEAALRHEDWMVRAQLTYVVARIGGEWGYRMLRALLADPVEEVRYDAATFHALFPGESTARDLHAFIAGAADADTSRAAAFYALKEMGEPAREVLQALSQHPNAKTAEYARFNLAILNGDDDEEP